MKKYENILDFLNDLDEDKRKQVDYLRQLIMETIPVTEHIKWNAPSYVYGGEDRITFNLHGEDIKILIHMGASKKEDKKAKPVLDDKTGIVRWNSNIRGTVSFKSMNDILIMRLDFINLLKQWVAVS
ncbi:MAG TPA: DUF1801 domain-containing protein [Candidatus Saccharimonadales bacterium]